MKQVMSLLFLFTSTMLYAHGMRTAYLELSETEGNKVLVLWKQMTLDKNTQPIYPKKCDVSPNKNMAGQSPEIARKFPGLQSLLLECRDSLAGQEVAVKGMGPIISEVVVRVSLADGKSFTKLLTTEKASWKIPVEQSFWEIAQSYIVLGFWHILEGPDHLLFLLALLLLVRRPRRLFWTATAFTLAHSITLCLTALDLVQVSSAATEACIALTLVLLALDIAVKGKSRTGPLIAFGFGLFHGFGFASALIEIGLPQQAIPLSLFTFNVGVELGQIVFLLGGLILLRLCSKPVLAKGLNWGGIYTVGVLGAYWVFERIVPYL